MRPCISTRVLAAAAAVSMFLPVAAQSQGMPAPPGMPGFDYDDARCREWGAAPGTKAYFECRATLEQQRASQAQPGYPTPYPSQPARPRDENVTDGMALSICEAHARKVAPYPIEKLASSFVFPGTEKRATLSFKITKPGSSLAFWNAECKFRGGVMTDFKAS